MTSKEIARRFSDIDETVLSYAEIKALCTGNPLIKEKLEIEREIGNLEILRKSHTMQRHRLEDFVNKIGPSQLAADKSYAEEIRNDLETLSQNPLNKEDSQTLPAFTIEGKVYTNKEEAAAALVDAFRKQFKEWGEEKIGNYRGFAVYARYDFSDNKFELILKNNHKYTVSTGKSTEGNLIRINNALSEVSLLETLQEHDDNIKNTEQEIETAELQLQHDFPQEAEYQEKLARLEELNRELGIGVDTELEQAGKQEAEKKMVQVEAAKPKPIINTSDVDVSDGYEEYPNNAPGEAELLKPEVKKRKVHEVTI